MHDLTYIIQIVQLLAYVFGLFVTVGTAIYFITTLKSDIRVVRHDMSAVMQRQTTFSEKLDDLTALLTKLAVQDQRLSGIEEDIRDIKHGRGFIQTDGSLKKV